TMSSETDTELISHLIDEQVQAGFGLADATRRAVKALEGSYAIVVLSESEPDRMVAAKSATPIVLGLGEGENFVASDIPALLEHTRRVLFLEDGEVAELTAQRVVITTFDGEPVAREPRVVTWDPVTAQKGGFKHFLLKEIHEQPQAIIDTMRGRILQEAGDVQLDGDLAAGWAKNIRRAVVVACGTAWHACLVGKFLLERLASLPCEVDYGSEFRYRDPLLDPQTLLIVVSQSGETADTLAAVATARERATKKYGHASDVLYLGRGINYPVALEGALKLKEISYIHAEGYPAGEMKHGPIALINEEMPVVVIIPHDAVFQKSLSNLKEVESRGGRIIVVTDAPSPELEDVAWEVLAVPRTNELLTPIVLTVPL